MTQHWPAFRLFLFSAVREVKAATSCEFIIFELRADGTNISIRGTAEREIMFFYWRAALQVTHVVPLSGPIDEGTLLL
jgi:hypothetical protein